MADTAVAITAGTGTSIDTRTESTNGHHRQVIVIGDPAENASVLGVNASQGIKVYSETAQAVTNAGLTNLDVLLSTRLASGSTLPITNKFLDAPLSNLLASGSTLPITNSYLENMDVLLSTRLASGSTLPITNTYLDIPLSTRLASGSTLPITNSYLSNIDTLLSTRLASGTTVPITGTVSVTGVATSAKQDTIIGHVDGIEGILTTIDGDTGTIATEVAGLLTDTELRATPVPVSGTVAVTNAGLSNIDVGLSTRLASGSTLPITNSFLNNIDTLLSTRLASGTTVPITGKVTDMGYYNPSLASYASGTTNPLSTDVNGNLNVTMNTQWTTAWFSASATNTIFKSTGGMLHLVTIEMQSSPTLSIYDNSSGVSGTLMVNLNANAPMGNYLQDIYFTGGISAKIHAGVAPSIKISYR